MSKKYVYDDEMGSYIECIEKEIELYITQDGDILDEEDMKNEGLKGKSIGKCIIVIPKE